MDINVNREMRGKKKERKMVKNIIGFIQDTMLPITDIRSKLNDSVSEKNYVRTFFFEFIFCSNLCVNNEIFSIFLNLSFYKNALYFDKGGQNKRTKKGKRGKHNEVNVKH